MLTGAIFYSFSLGTFYLGSVSQSVVHELPEAEIPEIFNAQMKITMFYFVQTKSKSLGMWIQIYKCTMQRCDLDIIFNMDELF